MQTYESDIIVWSQEQAGLIRARCFDRLDLEHIAEEIDVDDEVLNPSFLPD